MAAIDESWTWRQQRVVMTSSKAAEAQQHSAGMGGCDADVVGGGRLGAAAESMLTPRSGGRGDADNVGER